MQALVLIGGYGTRLRPLTYHVPKALAPIVNVPFLTRMVSYMERHGIDHIILTLGYLPDPIREHFKRFPCQAKIDFVVEEKPLGTGGAIKNAEHLLGERFLVLNGDVLTTINLKELMRFHEERGAAATIALTPVENPTIYGVVETEPDGRIRRFLEKPKPEEVTTNNINAGIYVYEKSVLDFIPKGQEHSVERGLYPTLLQKGAPLYAKSFPDYWIDIGSIEKYLKANFDVLSGKVSLPIQGREIRQGIWVEDDAEIATDAVLEPPVVLGKGCRVEGRARVGPKVVLGDGVVVGETAQVQEAVLWNGCKVERRAKAQQCILGRGCLVKEGAQVEKMRGYGDGEVVL